MKALAVIGSVFFPPTLEPLKAQLVAAGVETHVVTGRRCNQAWNEGLRLARKAGAEVLIVANDDIAVEPDDWPMRLLAHHEAGYSHVTAILARHLVNGVMGEEASRRSAGGIIEGKGHLFSMDLSTETPPIPADLQMYYGDDWWYWKHRYHGRCCLALDIGVRTGWEVPGLNDDYSGFSAQHPDFMRVNGGETKLEIATREHALAPRYFLFSTSEAQRQDGFLGPPRGLRPEYA